MTDLDPKDAPTLDYIEHLIEGIFKEHLINGVFMRQEHERVVIQTFNAHDFEQVKRLIDQKLEVGKERVKVISTVPK